MSAHEIIIRPAKLEEAQILKDLSADTFSDTYGTANTPENMELFLKENFSLSRINEELKDPYARIFFAFLVPADSPKTSTDNNLVGYIKLNLQKGLFDNDRDGLEIARIYVRKEYKGKQVGKKLFQKAVETAHSFKTSYIWLGVWEKNPDALSFYEKMGFNKAGKHLFKLGNDLQQDIIMKFML